MNPLWPPSSSSRNGKAGRGMGALAGLNGGSVGALAAPADGSSSASGGEPSVVAATPSRIFLSEY